MLYTLTFSHIVNGQRIPLTNDNGDEITKTAEASSKSAAIMDEEIRKFCADTGNDCRVRRII